MRLTFDIVVVVPQPLQILSSSTAIFEYNGEVNANALSSLIPCGMVFDQLFISII
jgi:uncharacterized protein (DUF169 family)